MVHFKFKVVAEQFASEEENESTMKLWPPRTRTQLEAKGARKASFPVEETREAATALKLEHGYCVSHEGLHSGMLHLLWQTTH